MNQQFKPIYAPALRMKEGELEGVRQLAADVQDCLLPRFIVPPKGERDETTLPLFDAQDIPDVSTVLSRNWRDRPVLVDATYLIDENDREKLADWLPVMFQRARKNGVAAIPAAMLADLGPTEIRAFQASIGTDAPIKFAICVPSDQMIGPEFNADLTAVLDRLGLEPEDCAVIADFAGTEFGDPHIVAEVIQGSLENLQEFGRWQHIIFQGTHYPETNPAKDGSMEVWPRNEWLAWKAAVQFDPTTAEYMIFGDYAADCAKMKFGKANAPAIRHIRYAITDSWLISRAVKTGTDTSRMHGVYKSLYNHAAFAGSGFSTADTFIARAANDLAASPGSAKTWRQLNTTHHITQVVRDIAKVRGVKLKEAPDEHFATQLSLTDS
jgi:hypothetical protein